MRRFCLLLLSAIAILPPAVSAFDGDRQGFVFGGGLGISPWARWTMAARHHFRSRTPSPFAAVGLGVCTFDRGGNYEIASGPGCLVATGVELVRHLNVSLDYCGGRTSEASRPDRGHGHLNVMISGWMY